MVIPALPRLNEGYVGISRTYHPIFHEYLSPLGRKFVKEDCSTRVLRPSPRFMDHLRGSDSSMCPLSKGVRTSRRVSDYHMPVLVPIRSSAGVKGAEKRLIPDYTISQVKKPGVTSR